MHHLLLSEFSVSSDYSLWLLPLCVVVAIFLTWLLYAKNERNKELGKRLRMALFVLRALALTLLCILLISPFIRQREPLIEKPIVIIGNDCSSSVKNLMDSADLENFETEIRMVAGKLSSDFEVDTYDFGEKVRKSSGLSEHSDRLTDISTFLKESEDKYENRNVGFMILASDGLYNRGNNPLYLSSNFQYPIYPVALGDTSVRRDSRIVTVKHNQLAFYGNTFEIEVMVEADLLRDRRASLKIQKKGRSYGETSVDFRGNSEEKKYKFTIPADELGLQKFDVELTPQDDEEIKVNNHRAFYVDILEGQQKVLILASSPHPDIKAIQEAVNQNKNYTAHAYLIGKFHGDIKGYDLVVLHQIPAQSSLGRDNKLVESDIPKLYILGKQSSVADFNSIANGVSLENFRGRFNEASPAINREFQYFNIDDGSFGDIPRFPPLFSPLVNFRFETPVQSLLFQKIGSVETEYPLLGFLDREGKKSAFIFGEGVWKWRLTDYKMHGSTKMFDGLIQKIVQYLASREDKSRFRVFCEPAYNENSDIVIEAEYYNKIYELNNERTAKFQLKDEAGQLYDYEFLPFGEKYRLDIGSLDEGNYSWTAQLDDGLEKFVKSGQLQIKALQLEMNNPEVNHQLLANLGERHGGRLLYPGDLASFADEILKDNPYKPVLHYDERLKEVINMKWLFFLIVLLFTAEWALRKWNGMI